MWHRACTTHIVPPPGGLVPPLDGDPGCEQLRWFPDGWTEKLIDRLWVTVAVVPLPRTSAPGWAR